MLWLLLSYDKNLVTDKTTERQLLQTPQQYAQFAT